VKAVIIDDERLARSGLRRLLKAHPEVQLVGEAADPEQAIQVIQKLSPDIIFLDVEMPGCDGFGLLEKLEDVPAAVIFTTAYDEYAVRAFEVSALDYLVKPITADRLAKSLARAQTNVASNLRDSSGKPGLKPQQIFVRDGDRSWIVRLSDIVLLESEGNYTRLHFGNNAPLIYRSLASIEERLAPTMFFRANRSQIVNLRCVESVENELDGRLILTLPKNKRIETSRRQSRRLRELLSL